MKNREAVGAAMWGRGVTLCLLGSLALIAGCSKDGESDNDESLWPQPFDVDAGEAASREVSADTCPADIDEYVDRIHCAELKADSVANELILHAVYVPHLVPGATLPPVVAVESRNAITTIRLDVAAVPAPPACRELREAFIDALKKVERLYNGMDRKSRIRIRWEVRWSQKAVCRYRELAAALQPFPELKKPDPFPIAAEFYVSELRRLETVPWSPPPKVMAEWNRLVDANVPDNDPAMRRVLRQMDRPECPYPWENKRYFIPPRFNDRPSGSFNHLDELGWILTGGKYHAFLFDAFVSWRGGMQSEITGCSNFSEMPNDDYNLVRFIAVRTIQQHLRQHPEDNWARIQKAGLLSVSNIKRGGMFGSISGFGSRELLHVLTPKSSEKDEPADTLSEQDNDER